MSRQPLRVLISGASVAGPTAAYWLSRHGFAVTVVERMPLAMVRTSGHAVDLFGPAMDVAERRISKWSADECVLSLARDRGKDYLALSW